MEKKKKKQVKNITKVGHQAYMDSAFYSEIHHFVITTIYIFQLVTSIQQIFGRNFFIWNCIITVSETTMIYITLFTNYGPIDPDHLQHRILQNLILHNIKYKQYVGFDNLIKDEFLLMIKVKFACYLQAHEGPH